MHRPQPQRLLLTFASFRRKPLDRGLRVDDPPRHGFRKVLQIVHVAFLGINHLHDIGAVRAEKRTLRYGSPLPSG